MEIHYKRPFAQFVKKASKALQLAIEDQVYEICRTPSLGVQKSGDLKDFLIHKFYFNRQECLIAYRHSRKTETIDIVWIDFYKVGNHENFYIELKRFIRQEKDSHH